MLKKSLGKRNLKNLSVIGFVSFIFIINPFLKTKAQSQGADFAVAIDYFHLGNQDQLSIGGMLQVPVGKRFTLNYELTVGIPKGVIYVHSYAGGYSSVVVVTNSEGHDMLRLFGVLLAFMPEGVGFYPDKKKNYHIAVNPLGVDYWHHKDPFEEITKLTGTVTVHLKLHTGAKFPAYIAPYIAASMVYDPGKDLDRYGFRAGILLGLKDSDNLPGIKDSDK